VSKIKNLTKGVRVSELKVLYKNLIDQIKKLPQQSGVYIFKDANDHILYIGKAKNLKSRGRNYIQCLGKDVKIDSIFAKADQLTHLITENELEALLLEAKMVQSHQPKFNVLLKHGQPFLYLFIAASKRGLPSLEIVRNKQKKGTYFGPFLEKGPARKVYNFLIKTFKLRLCKKKIPGGCLYFHMGQCAGACRDDFDKAGYLERLELAKKSLRQGHSKFLKYLKEQIDQANNELKFERARELHEYYQAFERVFYSLDHKPTDIEMVGSKDIWIYYPSIHPASHEAAPGTQGERSEKADHPECGASTRALFVFSEQQGSLKKKRVFYFSFEQKIDREDIIEYFLGYYRTFAPAPYILTNFDLKNDAVLFSSFLRKWHHKNYDISIMYPQEGHLASLIRLATLHAQQVIEKQVELPKALKNLLNLSIEPHAIDCFDISHKQGRDMVGSCVRFKDGQPDKPNFRHFHIKTVEGQDDYASLREIVGRRYKDEKALPDLIVIDGGKGQLNAVADLFPETEIIALAKREETVFSKRLPQGKVLDQKSFAGQMLIALRDYTHHFALSFHKKTEQKKYK